jgi:hypothetical protein
MLLELLELRDFLFDCWENFFASRSYRKFQRSIDRCAQLGHKSSPVAVFGEPGRQCFKCGYYVQISHDEFRRLFGATFKNAVYRTKQQEAR